jgi:hypothetical protein
MEVVEETTITTDGGGESDAGSVEAVEEEMKETPPSRKPPSILPPRPPLESENTHLPEGEGEGGENDIHVPTSTPEEKQHQPTREEKKEREETEEPPQEKKEETTEGPTQEKAKGKEKEEKEEEKEVEAEEEPKVVAVTPRIEETHEPKVHDKRRNEEEEKKEGEVRTVVAKSPLPTPRIVEPASSPSPPLSEATPHETEEHEKEEGIGEVAATDGRGEEGKGEEVDITTTTTPSRPPPKRSPPPSPKVSSSSSASSSSSSSFSHPVFNAKRAPHLGGKTQHQSFLNVFTSPVHALKPIPVFSSPSPSNTLSSFSNSSSSSSSSPSSSSSFASSLFPPTPASPTRTRHSLCGPTSLQQVHSPHPLSVQLGISLNLSGDLSGEIEIGNNNSNNNSSSSSLLLSSSPGSGDISNSPSSFSVAIAKMPFTARPMRQLESLSFDPPSLRRCFSEPFFNSWEFYPSVNTQFRKEEVDSLKNENEEEEEEEVVLQQGEEESTPRLPSEVKVDDGAEKNVKAELNEGGEEPLVVSVVTTEEEDKRQKEEVQTKEADAEAEAEVEESLILKSSPSLTDLSPIAHSVSALLEERTPTTTTTTTASEAAATTTTVVATEGKTLVSSDSKELITEDPRELLRRRDSSAKRTLIKKEINGKQVIVAGDIEQLISSLAPEDVLGEFSHLTLISRLSLTPSPHIYTYPSPSRLYINFSPHSSQFYSPFLSSFLPLHSLVFFTQRLFALFRAFHFFFILLMLPLSSPLLTLPFAQQHTDADYIDDFLISYRYFLTPTQLMSHLETRYEYLPTGFENEEEIKRRKQWEGPIRLRSDPNSFFSFLSSCSSFLVLFFPFSFVSSHLSFFSSPHTFFPSVFLFFLVG